MSIQDEIKETKEKLRETPVNKSTETERARLKSKIARLKEEREKKESNKGSSAQGYGVKKQGDATVALVGPPSVGKSTLLNKLTNAESEVGEYDFTTLNVIPGMMDYRKTKIQILDVPGLIGGASEGRGGGQEVLSVVRNSDLVLELIDPDRIDLLDDMRQELYDTGIRLDTEPPKVDIVGRDRGGIGVSTPPDFGLDVGTIRNVVSENGYTNCKVIIREDVDMDRFIDGIMDNRVYMPSVTAMNKMDRLGESDIRDIEESYPDITFISAQEGTNLEKLKEEIWNKLEMVRIYMKKEGKDPDREEPLVVDKGSDVGDVIDGLSKDFTGDFNYAKIWGESADFPGQKVGKDHVLGDEDVVELRF